MKHTNENITLSPKSEQWTFQLTYLHGSRHYLVANTETLRREFVVFEIEGHHIGEDVNHGVITEGVDAKNVEVSQEASRHRVPPATRGAHSADELEVDERDVGGILQIVPNGA